METDNHYHLESIAACDNRNSKLVMYFTINMAFANYLDMFLNVIESFLLIRDRTTYEQPLPINLSIPDFDTSLLHASTNLKNCVQCYASSKEIFDLKERHVSKILHSSKNFFSNNHIVDIFIFASSVISLMSTSLIIIKDVEASSNETNSECKSLAYIGIILTILSLIIVTFLHYKKSRFCKGYKFSNVVKIMMVMSDVQSYVPIELCKTAGSIHLFKIRGILKPKNIKLNKKFLWDMMEIDWKEVTVTLNDNKLNLPSIVVIKLHDKIKIRRLVNREPLPFHMMIKQGKMWFTLATETPEIV